MKLKSQEENKRAIGKVRQEHLNYIMKSRCNSVRERREGNQ